MAKEVFAIFKCSTCGQYFPYHNIEPRRCQACKTHRWDTPHGFILIGKKPITDKDIRKLGIKAFIRSGGQIKPAFWNVEDYPSLWEECEKELAEEKRR